MAKITCTRRLQFCAGHRVYKHESKCANLHGHNYVGYFTAEAAELNDLGMIIDFSVLKKRIGGWIDENWDHGFLYYKHDRDLKLLFTNAALSHKSFQCMFNPTAEEMAYYLLKGVCPMVLKDTGVTVTKVKLYETENCYAEAILS